MNRIIVDYRSEDSSRLASRIMAAVIGVLEEGRAECIGIRQMEKPEAASLSIPAFMERRNHGMPDGLEGPGKGCPRGRRRI